MALTRSTTTDRAAARQDTAPRAHFRWRELLLLALASALVGAGLYRVRAVKSEGFAEVDAGLAAKRFAPMKSSR